MNDTREERHDRAMYLADEGLNLRGKDNHVAAHKKFVEAFELESQVAESMSATAQPGHGVLHRSAAALAFDANRLEDAEILIDKGLAAGPIESIRAELVELKQLLKPTWEHKRIAGYPELLPQQVLKSLALLMPTLFIEVATTGRLAERPAQIHAADYKSGLFVYTHRDDFKAWKQLSADLNKMPSRIYIKADRQRESGQPVYPTVGVFGELSDEMANMLEQIFAPAPFSPFGYRREAA